MAAAQYEPATRHKLPRYRRLIHAPVSRGVECVDARAPCRAPALLVCFTHRPANRLPKGRSSAASEQGCNDDGRLISRSPTVLANRPPRLPHCRLPWFSSGSLPAAALGLSGRVCAELLLHSPCERSVLPLRKLTKSAIWRSTKPAGNLAAVAPNSSYPPHLGCS